MTPNIFKTPPTTLPPKRRIIFCIFPRRISSLFNFQPYQQHPDIFERNLDYIYNKYLFWISPRKNNKTQKGKNFLFFQKLIYFNSKNYVYPSSRIFLSCRKKFYKKLFFVYFKYFFYWNRNYFFNTKIIFFWRKRKMQFKFRFTEK